MENTVQIRRTVPDPPMSAEKESPHNSPSAKPRSVEFEKKKENNKSDKKE